MGDKSGREHSKREVVKLAKKPAGSDYFPKGFNGLNSRECLTYDLAQSAKFRKEKKYFKAGESLFNATLRIGELEEGRYIQPYLPGKEGKPFKKASEDELIKYKTALLKRAERLYHSAGKDSSQSQEAKYAAERAKYFIDNLEEEIGQLKSHEQSKGIESKVISILAIGSFIAGIFFLSTSITGNVIGNMANSTSNIIGAVLLVVGLVAGFFWLKSKRK